MGKSSQNSSESIRRRERGSGLHVPIVAVTVQASKSDRQHWLEPGIDNPVQVPELMHTIDSVFLEVHV